MSKESKQTFTLVLEPMGKCSRAEGYRRLKLALKALGRSYWLRCTKVTSDEGEVTADAIREVEP
jgi:hypothetical protein